MIEFSKGLSDKMRTWKGKCMGKLLYNTSPRGVNSGVEQSHASE